MPVKPTIKSVTEAPSVKATIAEMSSGLPVLKDKPFSLAFGVTYI